MSVNTGGSAVEFSPALDHSFLSTPFYWNTMPSFLLLVTGSAAVTFFVIQLYLIFNYFQKGVTTL